MQGESDKTIQYDGLVSIKKTFLWAERRMLVYGDRLEFLQFDRPQGAKIVISVSHISLSPIIRHHGSFEFTIFANEAGYLQRIRLRTPHLTETERLHALVTRVMNAYGPKSRMRPKIKLQTGIADAPQLNMASDGSPTSSLEYPSSSIMGPFNGMSGLPTYLPANLSHMYSSDNPHLSMNIIVVGVVLISAAIAQQVNSWFLTTTIAILLGACVAFLLSFYSIDPPYIHVMISFSPSQYAQPVPITPSRPKQSETRFGFRRPDAAAPRDDSVSSASSVATPLPTASDYTQPRRSNSYVQQPKNFHVNLDEVEAQSNSGRSSINEQDESGGRAPPGESPILFSESSKYVSQFAAIQEYKTCYSIFYSMAESIIQILATQPKHIGPPLGIRVVVPRGVELVKKVNILPDDIECIRNEWNLILNKGGLKVLTTKLSASMSRWPVISSVGTIKADVNAVYLAVACPDIYKKVDEFVGDYRIMEYEELVGSPGETNDGSGLETSSAEEAENNSISNTSLDRPSKSSRDMLRSETAPFLTKYQEMKSVWPVQPRDYVAGQSGFDLTLSDGRRGKLLISKSVDPSPRDPFPTGHEGFVRGSLTASAFMIIENADDSKHSDVWTFLHCDMKGNLSGNGKIADFITQSQMPKFFAKLETISIEQ